jgi:hypothetical protein
LTLRDDVLTGRYSDRDIEAFMLNHGRLNAAEAQQMIDVLKRQLLIE